MNINLNNDVVPNDDINKSTNNDNTLNISMNYNHEHYSDYTSKQ